MLILVIALSFKGFAITEYEAEQCIKRYYSYIQEYANDVSRTVELTKKIQAMFIDGKGSVYNDIFTILDDNPDTDGDVLSYLSSIDKYRTDHLLFIIEDIQVTINSDNTAHLEYKKHFSGGMYIYILYEEAVIKNGKIVCIYKKGTGRRENYANVEVKINSVQIAGADGNGNIITSYGVVLEKSQISRIRIKVDYEVNKNTELNFKMISPTANYTLTKEFESNNTSKLVNWGWESPGYFKEGYYKIELWNASNSKLLYTQTFTVKDTQTTTYLTVSNSELNFDANGGAKTITVTSNKDWEISVHPYSWGHLTRNGNTLTLRVDENTEREERTDFIKLSAADKEVRINITQEGARKITGEIEDITVDHNVFENGVKGMKIHIKFTVQKMKGIQGTCAVYMYYEDGTPLKDTNGSYRTTDGQCAFAKNFTPSYDDSIFNDFVIFVPLTELEAGKGVHNMKFLCMILENNQSIALSDYYSFTLTKN